MTILRKNFCFPQRKNGEKIKKIYYENQILEKKFLKIDRLTMLRKISFTTKTFEKIYEQIFSKNTQVKEKSELKAEKNDIKKQGLITS